MTKSLGSFGGNGMDAFCSFVSIATSSKGKDGGWVELFVGGTVSFEGKAFW